MLFLLYDCYHFDGIFEAGADFVIFRDNPARPRGLQVVFDKDVLHFYVGRHRVSLATQFGVVIVVVATRQRDVMRPLDEMPTVLRRAVTWPREVLRLSPVALTVVTFFRILHQFLLCLDQFALLFDRDFRLSVPKAEYKFLSTWSLG